MFQPWSQTISEPPPAPNPQRSGPHRASAKKRPRLSICHSRRTGSLSDRSSILTSRDTLKCSICHQIKTSDDDGKRLSPAPAAKFAIAAAFYFCEGCIAANSAIVHIASLKICMHIATRSDPPVHDTPYEIKKFGALQMDTDEREQVDMDYAADEEGGEKAPVDAQSNDKKIFVPPNDKKRVKVYELRKNDWYDRGTGYCTGRVINHESKVFVESEDKPIRMLLDTRISKDDTYQKQQDTLIVWTESNGIDMALSFQEADGCAAIWEFVSQVQQNLSALPDDALSDDAMDGFPNPLVLPPAELKNLDDVEGAMRQAVSTQPGRDALSKFIIGEDYIRKLIPLVGMAEDLESIEDLHHLCNIMKMLILLNDNQIIEHVVSDGVVDGVVGALEFDPEFPTQKANHRRYLKDGSRYKEVVFIADPNIRKKIHATWRLQYLKDVVLARILDDPTFSVLNSLIFFNQVDIVTHLQANTPFLEELFGIIDSNDQGLKRKKDAVGLIQQCCAIAKNLQAPARTTLYTNFIHHGLLRVIKFSLMNRDASIRVAGTDILVAMIDHDASMVRTYIFKSIGEKKTPLTETLIELLLVEVDLGVKAQVADAIKVLLEPQIPPPLQENMNRVNGESMPKLRTLSNSGFTDPFIEDFYAGSANKLFQPLKDLESRKSLHDLTLQEVSLFNHLIEILMFLIRQHLFRSKYLIFSEGLAARIAQLLSCPQKHLKLTAIKFFRSIIALGDDFYHRQLTQNNLLEPILNIVYETMPRDNLLNSACLELFEFIKRESVKPLISHFVENHRERLEKITYVDTFKTLVLRYDQMQEFFSDVDTTLFNNENDTRVNSNQRWQGVGVGAAKDLDAAEEAYFNTSDDEDEPSPSAKPTSQGKPILIKSLVDYPDDDDEIMEPTATNSSQAPDPSSTSPTSTKSLINQEGSPPSASTSAPASPTPQSSNRSTPSQTPPERLSEKRRRQQDDEEDELGKLSITNKRRSSSAGATSFSASSHQIISGHSLSNNNNNNNFLRRKKGFGTLGSVHHSGKDSPNGPKKIEISLASVKRASAVGSEIGAKRDDGG